MRRRRVVVLALVVVVLVGAAVLTVAAIASRVEARYLSGSCGWSDDRVETVRQSVSQLPNDVGAIRSDEGEWAVEELGPAASHVRGEPREYLTGLDDYNAGRCVAATSTVVLTSGGDRFELQYSLWVYDSASDREKGLVRMDPIGRRTAKAHELQKENWTPTLVDSDEHLYCVHGDSAICDEWWVWMPMQECPGLVELHLTRETDGMSQPGPIAQLRAADVAHALSGKIIDTACAT